MPTSVLLAVLAAAGLLALAPALARRYDATERLEAERAQSTARVLNRTRRSRTVPGPRPVNPSRVLVATLRTAAPPELDPTPMGERPGRVRPAGTRQAGRPERPARPLAAVPRSAPPAQRRRPGNSPAIYRRRRVLAALLLLNFVELIGVLAVGPGFWVGFAVTGTVLVAFLCYLRYLAVVDRRRRRAEARRDAWLAARQAQVRREQERRMAKRRAAARRMAEQRESLRRTDGWSAPPTVSYRRASGERGG